MLRYLDYICTTVPQGRARTGVCGGASAREVLMRRERSAAEFDEQGYDVNSIMLLQKEKRHGDADQCSVVLVVLLVLMAVLLILLSRGGNFLSDLGGEKIDVAGEASECETLCFKCCRGERENCGPTSTNLEIRNCNCVDNDITNYGC